MKITKTELTEANKKKKPYSSMSITTGDIGYNIAQFNKHMGTDNDGYLSGTISAQSSTQADSAGMGGGDSGSSAGGCCEALELDETAVYVPKVGQSIELPDTVETLARNTVENFIDKLAPEENFAVGYITPVYLYKEIWEYLPIFKCTEYIGFTGVDFADSEDVVNTDKEARIKNAQNMIDKAKATGKTTAHSEVTYNSQNKLVKQHNGGLTNWNGKSSILFYPEAILRICYWVKLPGRTDYLPISANQLENYIYEKLDQINAKLETNPDLKNKWTTKIHTYFWTGDTALDIDYATRSNADIQAKLIKKYNRDKLSVRALYTEQIYYLEKSDEKLGTRMPDNPDFKISEELEEAKRYVRRYYMRPQNIALSNKTDVLLALIEHEDEDCVIYTLNNLGDTKDFSKLSSRDIIYYYEDGILYDKNHIRIMNYDLSIKREEERAKIDPETISDAKFGEIYADRLTDMTKTDDVKTWGSSGNNGHKTVEDYNPFNEDFDSINVSGESLHEAKEEICCICGEPIKGYGNNPEPYVSAENGERCCDACNLKFVVPTRLDMINKGE